MRAFLRRCLWCIASLVAFGVLAVVLNRATGLWSHRELPSASARQPTQQDEDDPESAVPVRTIEPKSDPTFTLSVSGPAEVAPYEWADLESQVAGRVEFIRKAEGSPVTKGELLIKIAVPDLDADVREKESLVRQRQAELRYCEANERIAKVAVKVRNRGVEVAGADVDLANAMQDYRGKEFRRLRGLVADQAATQQVVEEHERYYQAAVADTTRARAGVLKAQADVEEAEAKLDAAKADIQLKGEMVDVARKNRDHTQALADYARIVAPFDGVVTRRNVNPGSFVQNATTAHTAALLRVERRDIVTVKLKVPDTFASYVTNGTEAVIQMSELPGEAIYGHVSRFSPTLESAARDHTLLVEVDLFNGTRAEYEVFLAKEKAKPVPFDDLKEGPLPVAPKVAGKDADNSHRLYPGMYGEMRLVFRHLANVYLLPSDAIVRRGGTPYIFLVEAGKAERVPVEVQVDDQRLAKVVLLNRTPTGMVKRDLTGKEQVIYSNQGELTDGQAVASIPQEWTPQD